MLPTEATAMLSEGNHINEKFDAEDLLASHGVPTTNGNTKHSHVRKSLILF